eukprot:UC4_evm1s136
MKMPFAKNVVSPSSCVPSPVSEKGTESALSVQNDKKGEKQEAGKTNAKDSTLLPINPDTSLTSNLDATASEPSMTNTNLSANTFLRSPTVDTIDENFEVVMNSKLTTLGITPVEALPAASDEALVSTSNETTNTSSDTTRSQEDQLTPSRWARATSNVKAEVENSIMSGTFLRGDSEGRRAPQLGQLKKRNNKDKKFTPHELALSM